MYGLRRIYAMVTYFSWTYTPGVEFSKYFHPSFDWSPQFKQCDWLRIWLKSKLSFENLSPVFVEHRPLTVPPIVYRNQHWPTTHRLMYKHVKSVIPKNITKHMKHRLVISTTPSERSSSHKTIPLTTSLTYTRTTTCVVTQTWKHHSSDFYGLETSYA